MMNEFIARAYPFRQEDNRNYARVAFSLAACDEDHFSEDDFTVARTRFSSRSRRTIARAATVPKAAKGSSMRLTRWFRRLWGKYGLRVGCRSSRATRCRWPCPLAILSWRETTGTTGASACGARADAETRSS